MPQFAFGIFVISLCIFVGIMRYEPRTLWSGCSFFCMMICTAFFLLIILYQYSEWLASHDVLIGIMIIFFFLAILCAIAFPGLLVITFLVEGIRIIKHEGIKQVNFLSVLFSVLLCSYLIVWPIIGDFEKNVFGTVIYLIISFSIIYVLSLLAVYILSAILNLIHLKKSREADYIIVLGSGIIGKKVTPLLAARIEKGIRLLQYNPNAMMIMSGGQGVGEDIPESEAMAAYAIDKGVDTKRILLEQKSVSTEQNLLFSRNLIEKETPKIIIVTTAYHVFRALILARKQGMRCVGFGSKTKWYFTLNALIREFMGYLSLTWKKHICVIGVVTCIIIIICIIGRL